MLTRPVLTLTLVLIAVGETVPASLIAADVLHLPASNGEQMQFPLPDQPRLTVLCFLGTECPLARLYGPRLARLSQQYQPEEVRFLGINSNPQDSREEVQRFQRIRAAAA